MPITYRQYPKCGHVLPQPLPASASCPVCGIDFFKWSQSLHAPDVAEAGHASASRKTGGYAATLLQPLQEMDSMTFYGRCVMLTLLASWSWFLVNYDYRTGEMSMSFMHNIVLPIHEASHVLFRPFGEFMTILGGSLFQILFPLGDRHGLHLEKPRQLWRGNWLVVGKRQPT